METIRISMLPNVQDCCRRACVNQFHNIIIDAGYSLNDRRVGIYTAVGNGTHAAIRNLLSYKIVTGQTNKEKDNVDAGIAEYDKSVKEADEPLIYDKITPTHDAAYKQIVRFVKIFRRDVEPHLKFPETATDDKCIERDVERKVKGYTVRGHIDITTFKTIFDTKTGARIRPYHTQLGGYGNLAISDGDPKPEHLAIIHIPRVSLDKSYPGTKFIKYDVDFCLKESWYVINQLIRDVEDFKIKGDPACFKANPQSTLCSDKYCRAYGTDFCKYFQR